MRIIGRLDGFFITSVRIALMWFLAQYSGEKKGNDFQGSGAETSKGWLKPCAPHSTTRKRTQILAKNFTLYLI